MKKIILLLFLFYSIPHFLIAQESDSTRIAKLEKRLKELEKNFNEKQAQSELDKLLQDAEKESSENKDDDKLKTFQSGQRSLQAINPEISVSGDSYAQYIIDKPHFNENERSGFYFRTIALHVQSNLDPFSFVKGALEFNSGGVEFDDFYATFTDLLPNTSFTFGKFRQQFGIVNRWHEHAVDQVDYPLALTTILGDEGLAQTGLSINWLMPNIIANSNELTFEVTNGENDHLFEGEFFSVPTFLIHLKNYWDVNNDSYLELGLSGMYGQNNISKLDGSGNLLEEATRKTLLGGIDLTYMWEPTGQALYHSLVWRSELFYADKELINNQNIKAFGAYSYLEYKLNQQLQIGFRFDYSQPFEVDNNSQKLTQYVPYITWWQSPWVKFRLQYNGLRGNSISDSNQLRLQLVWAIGPHKHDRY